MFKKLGPAILITSAFIGPGTVTVCSIAGAKFGFSLLWALLFSIFATVILQEMCARLGVVTQKGLGETIREQLSNPLAKWFGVLLVASAILIGNAAYEAGNISGAALGLEAVNADLPSQLWIGLIGVCALLLLLSGSYKLIEKSLIVLVSLMSITFLITAIIVRPDLGSLFSGFIPSFPSESTFLIIGLIGTTVVPYNFFLHASSVSERWKRPEELSEARLDTVVSIALGGLISMSIVITSAVAGGNISSAKDLAIQLEPIFGTWSRYFIGAGLFAAGLSSSITAPLAAAYATSGVLGKNAKPTALHFRVISVSILLIGVTFSLLGFKPVSIIQFAQFANGLLLPLIAGFLLWVMNSQVLGGYRNSMLQNTLGGLILVITIGLGLKSILSVMGII